MDAENNTGSLIYLFIFWFLNVSLMVIYFIIVEMIVNAENNVKRRSRKISTMTASEAKQHKDELEKLQHKVTPVAFVVSHYILVVLDTTLTLQH
jgi:uncharacterized protein YybS (DUF2232 family)